ncbi:MAG TPA: polysaccharide biosynthesis tyrosine autokinase [Mycobacterium sp.]|nr:polysaccharide biosynthesis tyrosine autokinase [Mycobacterium sp.]
MGQSLSASNPDYNQILASQRLSQTYADLATTTPVLDRVIAKEALSTTAVEFRRRVTADAPRDSTLLHIVVQDSDPQRASDIANTLAAEIMASSPALVGRDSDVQRFIDQDLAATQGQIEATERELERLMDVPDRSPADEAQLDTLNGRLVGLRQAYANLVAFSSNSGANLLTVVDPAKADAEPTSPDLLLNTIIGVIAALLVAIGIVFLLDYLDDTIKSSAEVEELLGLPTLGRTGIIRSARKLNADARIAAISQPRSVATESYRTLRTNLDFMAAATPIKTLLITSAIPGEGKTTTAANLAVVFAQAGRRTILLDADLRSPGVDRFFNVPNGRGLTNLLVSKELPIAEVAHRSKQPGLLIITSGPPPPNPAELLASPKMLAILDRLAGMSDIVILDSPPILAVSDALILASGSDATLVVVDAARTHRSAVQGAREALSRSGARILGVAINRLRKGAGAGHPDYDYSGSYNSPNDGQRVTDAIGSRAPERVPPMKNTR